MPAYLATRLALFQGAIFTAMGIAVPYWALWLDSRGMSSIEIGMLLSLPVWTRLITGPAAAWIADHSGDTRRVLCWLCVGALTSYSLFGFAENFWSFLAIAMMAGTFFTAILPLADDLTLRAAYRHSLDYGRIRLWGSITFISASALGGIAVAQYAKDVILAMMLAGFALTVLASFALPNVPRAAGQNAGGRIWPLLRSPAFATFLFAAAMINASHGVLYGFATLHWEKAGHGSSVIGWLWAESAIIEIGVFAAGAALVRRIGVVNLLAIGAAACVARWLILGSTTLLPALVFAQALHSLTFGAAHLGAMHFIARTAPPGLSARAQMAYAAVALGLGNGTSMMAAGFLYSGLGGGAFDVMAVLGGLGLLATLRLRRIWNDPSAPRPA
jgi:MFS transporter, PPP family, 3-phenylpropionic acid transporter